MYKRRYSKIKRLYWEFRTFNPLVERSNRSRPTEVCSCKSSLHFKSAGCFFVYIPRIDLLHPKNIWTIIISHTFCHYFAIVLSSHNDKMVAKRCSNVREPGQGKMGRWDNRSTRQVRWPSTRTASFKSTHPESENVVSQLALRWAQVFICSIKP